ncbi:MAG: biotin--[acetyl-CoA-carboxylase] ligase [Leptolyngbyaceae cyanobacterium]
MYIVEHWRIIEALNRPAQELGVLPALASLRPQLDLCLYDSLPSTNREAWRLVEQGRGAGTVVIARQQSAGRGQWGRTWVSSPGGLYLSLVLEPELAITEANLLTMASAWGVATSLENLGITLQIKWPNDLVSQGQKVGGILTESRVGQNTVAVAAGRSPTPDLQHAVIGLGVNWRNPLPPNATSIRRLLPDSPRVGVKSLEDLAAVALRGLLQGYYYWQHHGPLALIRAYEHKLAHMGQQVTLDGHIAVVEGVSSNGSLIVVVDQDGAPTTRFLKPGEISLGYNG